jgi:uncharacterized protein YcnI
MSVRRFAVVLGGALVGAFAFAGVADAHVTVNPDAATQGGYGRFAFRVPTESDTLSTTKVDVYLDMTHPIGSVSTMPVPGWTAKVITSKLPKPITNDDGDEVTEAVSEVVWTANTPADAITPGEFNEFPVSLGPLPEVDSLVFKVLQTYSDGSVVRWIDPTTPGGAEPEHPAPVLHLAPAVADSTASATGPAVAATTTDSGASLAALPVAIVAAVLGLIGAALGGAAFARSRRT